MIFFWFIILLLVSVAGVIQEADSAYQINNNEITFATAPANGDDAFIIVLGLALGIGDSLVMALSDYHN